MATRRDAREWIVQLLFQLDLNPVDDVGKVLDRFWRDHAPEGRIRRFVERIVRGVFSHRDEIDTVLKGALEHWDMERLAVTDRCVLRMAVFELLHENEIPPVVTINEAVDIAKYFGTVESGRFVNGVLDRISQGLDRPLRSPAGDA